MPPPSKTATSTPRLSEYARHFSYPPGITKTVWPRVEAKGRELGLGFDWWQSQLGTVCLGYGEDGRYRSTVGGIGLSIPRQVGKTYFVLALLVIMCILFPGLQVVWTAHHLRTSTKTFTTVRGICRRKKVAPHIKPGGIRAANGEQQVEFVNGSMIMFGSRKMGFGRGFDEVDVEVFDEAQILDTKSLEDMIAATNQARHEHGALLFFMGTPPRKTDPSAAFTERRAEALAGNNEDAVWLEIGAEPKSATDDPAQYPKMNPSYPKRTPLESIQRLRKNLKDDDSWNREGRGVWDEAAVSLALPQWDKRRTKGLELGTPGAIGLAAAVDHAWASIAAAAGTAELVTVGAVDRRAGTAWLVSEAKRIQDTHGCSVVIDKRGPLADLVPVLVDAGVFLTVVDTGDFCDACAQVARAVEEGSLQHPGHTELDAAVHGASWRNVGDRRAFARKTSEISMLEAATLAAWGVMSGLNYDIAQSAY